MLIFVFCVTTIPKQCKVVTWSGRLTHTDSTLDTSRLVHSAPQSISKHTWYLVSIMCRSVQWYVDISVLCNYSLLKCGGQDLLITISVSYLIYVLRIEWSIEYFVIILNFWYMVRTTQHTKMLTIYGYNGQPYARCQIFNVGRTI